MYPPQCVANLRGGMTITQSTRSCPPCVASAAVNHLGVVKADYPKNSTRNKNVLNSHIQRDAIGYQQVTPSFSRARPCNPNIRHNIHRSDFQKRCSKSSAYLQEVLVDLQLVKHPRAERQGSPPGCSPQMNAEFIGALSQDYDSFPHKCKSFKTRQPSSQRGQNSASPTWKSSRTSTASMRRESLNAVAMLWPVLEELSCDTS